MKPVVRLEMQVLESIIREMPERASRVVRLSAQELEGTVKLTLNKRGTGREYPRGGGKVHQASAPGSPPARDYGNLINSIHVQQIHPLTARVADGTEYGLALELGSPPNLAPRPFMVPSVEKMRPAWVQRWKELLK
jgi:RNA 3'-terminal phosphate cyclase